MTPQVEVLTQQIGYFRRVKPKVRGLADIWVPGHPLTLDIFLERAKNGLAEGNIWNGNSMTLIECYIFLSYDIGCVRKMDRDMTNVYNAFKGSFTVPNVNDPRALRDRESKRGHTYRRRQKAFRDFLYNLFYDFT